MKIIDISWPISEKMTEYKNRKTVARVHTKVFETDGARESTIAMHLHSGTHVDAPAHFLRDGASIEQLPPSHYIGPCRVLDLTNVQEKITAADLNTYALHAHEIILLKTKNSALTTDAPFNPGFIYLDASGARYFAEIKVKTVGIDYVGIERNQPNHETHVTLLTHSIGIIEGLRLAHVEPGSYFLICLPLLIPGADAVPARAVLLTHELNSSTFQMS